MDQSTDQVIKLTGATNFREVSGYAGADGRRLRRGRLWRSARLDALTEEDRLALQRIGLRTVFDLRGPHERLSHPTCAIFASTVVVHSWDHASAAPDPAIVDVLCNCRDSDSAMTAVAAMYRAMAEEHELHYRQLLLTLAQGELPALVHCTAGKDRTGVAIALVLELLGVDRGLVLADYARSEQLIDYSRLAGEAARGLSQDLRWTDNLPPHSREMLMRSAPAFLEAAFADIEERYGSVAGYCENRLGIGPSEVEQLRGHLLEG